MKDKFPGFKKCMEMMRSRNPGTSEDGFHWLSAEASGHVQELIEAFHTEEEFGIRCWLLELVDAAKSDAAFEFLADQLRGDDWQIRSRAMQGLSADMRKWQMQIRAFDRLRRLPVGTERGTSSLLPLQVWTALLAEQAGGASSGGAVRWHD